jgi:hypothetical protein
MFAGEQSFNQNQSRWDVSSVINMVDMFIGAAGFNQPLDEWDTSSVTNLERMFKGATSFNENLQPWGNKIIFQAINVNGMFVALGCTNQTSSIGLSGSFCAVTNCTAP